MREMQGIVVAVEVVDVAVVVDRITHATKGHLAVEDGESHDADLSVAPRLGVLVEAHHQAAWQLLVSFAIIVVQCVRPRRLGRNELADGLIEVSLRDVPEAQANPPSQSRHVPQRVAQLLAHRVFEGAVAQGVAIALFPLSRQPTNLSDDA